MIFTMKNGIQLFFRNNASPTAFTCVWPDLCVCCGVVVVAHSPLAAADFCSVLSIGELLGFVYTSWGRDAKIST